MKIIDKKTSRLWLMATSLSILLLFAMIFMWVYDINYHHQVVTNQITKQTDISEALTKYPFRLHKQPIYIPTGIFIQSFFFKDPQTVVVSGVIWQKFNAEALANHVTQGFILPENNLRISPQELYNIHYNDYQLVGWGFVGASLYQQFDYSNYPFDEQIIWIRILPREFSHNAILVPDLAAYSFTDKNEVFGLASDITLRGLNILNTYFNYFDFKSTTNFGMANVSTNKFVPELGFNITIRRHFFDIFLLYLLPVIVVWGLLFGLTMVMSSEREKADAFKFSTMGSLSTLAGAFFAILFSQINMRLNFSGHPVTYIEYFYFVTYAVIFLLALNSYLIASRENTIRILMWRNNLLPKLLFWPLILGFIDLITWIKLFTAY